MLRLMFVLAGVALALCGCQKPAAEFETASAEGVASGEPEMFTSDPAAELIDEQPTARAEPIAAPPAPVSEKPKQVAVRSHQVASGDSLYSLARKYYNDERRWKEIHEANRDRISDPNALQLGQVLLIP